MNESCSKSNAITICDIPVKTEWKESTKIRHRWKKSNGSPPPKKKTAPAAFGETPKESFLFFQSEIFFFCSLEYLIQSNRLPTKKKKKKCGLSCLVIETLATNKRWKPPNLWTKRRSVTRIVVCVVRFRTLLNWIAMRSTLSVGHMPKTFSTLRAVMSVRG